MSTLSDQLLLVTVLCYLVAMVGHAAEYAFGVRGTAGRAAARQRDLVPAGAAPSAAAVADRGLAGGGPADPTTAPAAEPGGPQSRGPQPRAAALAGRIAAAATVLGAATHLATMVTRGVAAERVPWGNMYEYLVAATFVGTAAWLVTLWRRPALRHLGLYVALVNVLLLGLAGTALYTPIAPLQPALNSAWLVIHVAAAVLSSGIFLVGFVAAAMYLIRAGHDAGKVRFPYPIGARLPAAEVLERLTFRLHAFAFPIWTFAALIAGPIWAEAAWGRYWGWDPKEVWAFVTWVIYAAYLHARATPSVRRGTAAWLAIAGWGGMMMNLFGVNIFFSGLHSYAGL